MRKPSRKKKSNAASPRVSSSGRTSGPARNNARGLTSKPLKNTERDLPVKDPSDGFPNSLGISQILAARLDNYNYETDRRLAKYRASDRITW